MKIKIIIIILLSFSIFSNKAYSQTSDTTLTYLVSLNLEYYKNKPVDSFIAVIPTNYLNMRIASPGNPKYAEVLSILYANKVFAWIYVYNFQFMNPRSETMTWDMNLFRKENIHHIEIWKAVDCYKGCPDGIPTTPIAVERKN
ncbi:MAG: hypothetical protein JNM14_09220 [Ferruginibacter sp.]|nr:hypothetical protein [Ferruginibacter sp.]